MERFWKFIEDTRKKPVYVRTHIAFLGSLLLTFVVGLVWVTTIPAQFASLQDTSTGALGNAAAEVKDTVSMFNEATEQLKADAPELNFRTLGASSSRDGKEISMPEKPLGRTISIVATTTSTTTQQR